MSILDVFRVWLDWKMGISKFSVLFLTSLLLAVVKYYEVTTLARMDQR